MLDNAYGSGSFLVAAKLENKKFIEIEKNDKSFLFKKKPIDLIKVYNQRLKEVL